MNRIRMRSMVLATGIALGSVVIIEAAPPRTYQVTGPLVELSAEKFVLAVREERMEIARDANTQVAGDLTLGATVTVTFRMSATAVTVKDEPAAQPNPTPPPVPAPQSAPTGEATPH